MQIGVAGLGKMGAAIAARLIEVGHTVTVWNRTPARRRLADAGAKVAATPPSSPAQRGRHHHPHRCRGDRRGL